MSNSMLFVVALYRHTIFRWTNYRAMEEIEDNSNKRKNPAVASSSRLKRQKGNELPIAAVTNIDTVESTLLKSPLSVDFVKSILSIKVKERFPNRIPAILKKLRAIYNVSDDISVGRAIIDGHDERDVEIAVKWSITILNASKKDIKDELLTAGFTLQQVKTKSSAITSFLTSLWYEYMVY